jgi:hypothetical protein
MAVRKPEETDDARWRLLRKRYEERGLVLPVSKANGVPDWLELLRLVGERCWGSARPLSGRASAPRTGRRTSSGWPGGGHRSLAS